MLGSPCSPCCSTPQALCNGLQAFNSVFADGTYVTLNERSIVAEMHFPASNQCGGPSDSYSDQCCFSCFIKIPAGSSSVMTLSGSVPSAGSYVFLGMTEAAPGDSGQWMPSTFSIFGAQAADVDSSFSGPHLRNNIAYSASQTCGGSSSLSQNLTVSSKEFDQWYGIDFFMHNTKFGIGKFPSHAVTATISW